jgi:methylase of polypeptide subunit release factors
VIAELLNVCPKRTCSFVVLLKNKLTKGNMSKLTEERIQEHETVSPAVWLVARRDLLTRGKELTRLRDQLAAERRALPWVKIDKNMFSMGRVAK